MGEDERRKKGMEAKGGMGVRVGYFCSSCWDCKNVRGTNLRRKDLGSGFKRRGEREERWKGKGRSSAAGEIGTRERGVEINK